MSDAIRIHDMSADELSEHLVATGVLTREQATALRQFVEKVGGLENAYDAIEMLGELEDAA